jgi:hypothetical protein
MTKDEALKLALEALEGADEIDCDMRDAITAIKEALAQPEHCSDCGQKLGDANHIHTCSPQSMHPQLKKMLEDYFDKCFVESATQRLWVGLTDEQFLEACKIAESGNYMVAFQRIQQWLMENNT